MSCLSPNKMETSDKAWRSYRSGKYFERRLNLNSTTHFQCHITTSGGKQRGLKGSKEQGNDLLDLVRYLSNMDEKLAGFKEEGITYLIA